MRPNPITDAIQFLAGSALFYIFILLVIASLVIAGFNLIRDSDQRNLKDLSSFILRFFVGCMWWQQSLWKLPPTYTDRPDGSGGLRYWVDRMVDGAAFQRFARRGDHRLRRRKIGLPDFHVHDGAAGSLEGARGRLHFHDVEWGNLVHSGRGAAARIHRMDDFQGR